MNYMEINEDKLFDDTYMVLTGKKTQEQILEQEHSLYLLFDPEDNDIDIDKCCDHLIEYFIITEEYERCAELVSLKSS